MLDADLDITIARKLAAVDRRREAAAHRAGRSPADIHLIAVSKTFSADAVRAAARAGQRAFGENRVQEALDKVDATRDLGLEWHLIGHLQTNKAKIAAASFAIIQSLDSTRLADALARAQKNPPVRALIEVNLGDEASKSGVAPDDVAAILDAARGKVEIDGLMTIPPPAATPELARPYFVRLRELRDSLAMRSGLALRELSMGMTDDFEIAIEEGATIVRVGRAVFGERIP